jgi:acetyl esterase/lipase
MRALLALLLAILPAFPITRQEIVFATTPQGQLKLTLFYPPDWKPSDHRPAALFFFGGGFVNGTPTQFFSKAAYLASRGMVTASAEYRIKNKHKTTPIESLADCRTAFKWLRANAATHGIDPARIAAGGGSAGGTCAMHLATEPDAKPNLLLLYNPATNAETPFTQVPQILFYGTDDRFYLTAKPFFQKARELKIPIELYYAKGQQHGFFNDKPNADYSWHTSTLYMTDVFLAKHGYLQGKPTIAHPTGSKAVLFSEAAPIPTPQQPRPLPPNIRAERDIVYAKIGDRELKLDIYLPNAESQTKRPLIVWIHGGAWRAGTKEQTPILPLVQQGYAGASIGYRYTQEAPFPANVDDCKTALRWLRANAEKYNIDPTRIALWGSSAGGHLVAYLGTTGDDPATRVQAVVDWFGPTRVARMSHYPSAMDHDSPESPENQLIGALIQQNTELAEKANPARYASKDDPPFFIQHGDADPLVPMEQSEILATALKAAGAQVEFEVLHGAGHGGPQFQNPQNLQKVKTFLDRVLK